MGVNTRLSEATPEEIEDAINHIQDWMLSNNAIGRRLGWVIHEGTPDPDQDTGIPNWADMGVVNSMAMYLAPYFNKPIHPSWQINAGIGMQTISSRTVEVQSIQYPAGFPRGKANTRPYGPKYYHPDNRIVTGGDYLTDEGDDPITTP